MDKPENRRRDNVTRYPPTVLGPQQKPFNCAFSGFDVLREAARKAARKEPSQ